jgi:hypothetical protein
MYRQVRCLISSITVEIVLENEKSFSQLPAQSNIVINADYNCVHY